MSDTHFNVSNKTRRLLASALRSLAQDLEHDVAEMPDPFESIGTEAKERFQELVNDFLKRPKVSNDDDAREAVRKFLGLPEGCDPEYLRGTRVRIPMARRAR